MHAVLNTIIGIIAVLCINGYLIMLDNDITRAIRIKKTLGRRKKGRIFVSYKGISECIKILSKWAFYAWMFLAWIPFYVRG